MTNVAVMFREEIAPKHLAEDWDNVGLIIGDLEKDINIFYMSRYFAYSIR